MTLKVALIRPKGKNPYWASQRPSLGVGYLASYLIAHKINCRIFDANFWGWNEKELLAKVADYQPELTGFSAMTHEIVAANQAAGNLKQLMPKTPVVIGGCHLTALPKETLREFTNFDYGIYGEGEKPLLQLAKSLGNISKIKRINSLVYRDKKGRIQLNPPAERLTSKELDYLPYPAFDQYYSFGSLSGPNDYYVILASRGCPYNCAFCMRVLGRQVRRRSPENIVKEIKWVIEKYKAHTFCFQDEIFLFNDELTFKTLKLMKEVKESQEFFVRGRFRWSAMTRADLVNEGLIRACKEAGCFALDIGIESGSNQILKRIDKRITTQQAERAIKIIKKAGIQSFAYFILGHPGETRKTIRKTIDFAVRLNPDSIAVGLMVPYPGTKIFQMALKGEGNYQLISRDWSKYDKYGGSALQLRNLPLQELEKWQRRMFLEFYLKNGRFLDLAKFLFKYKKEIFWLLNENLVFKR